MAPAQSDRAFARRQLYRALRVFSFNPVPHKPHDASQHQGNIDGGNNLAAFNSAADEVIRVAEPLEDTHHHLATVNASLLLPVGIGRSPKQQTRHQQTLADGTDSPPDGTGTGDGDDDIDKSSPLGQGITPTLSTTAGEEELSQAVRKVTKASRRQKLRRLGANLKAFLSTWEGIIMAVYGILVVISGSALVLFLLGWVDHGRNKEWWIEFWSQFVNALFTIPGVGLIPWRIRDTWDICCIAHYQHTTWRYRRERGLPPLEDKHEIPTFDPESARGDALSAPTLPQMLVNLTVHNELERREDERLLASGSETDEDAASSVVTSSAETPAAEGKPMVTARAHQGSAGGGSETELLPLPVTTASSAPDARTAQPSTPRPDTTKPIQVLSEKQARRLRRLQKRLQRTQPWYLPDSTPTRRAFPIGNAMLVMLLLDLNSIMQCLMCAAMWGYVATDYRKRPAWMTATTIVISFLAGIAAGVLIVVGAERTKRKEVVRKALEKSGIESGSKSGEEVEQRGGKATTTTTVTAAA